MRITERKIRFTHPCICSATNKNKAQKSANQEQVKGKDLVNTAFAPQFTQLVNSRANGVFTIFALDLTVIYIFCTLFERSNFDVNRLFGGQ